MNPIVYVRNTKELSPYKRKKLCEHNPHCDKYLIVSTLNEGLTMCKKDALAYSQAIFNELQVSPSVHVKTTGWKEEEVKALIRFISTHDINRGTYAELAGELHKTKKQIKDKVYYLRNKGVFL